MIDLTRLFCSSDASCLWPPNWSQFLPDVIVALITGAVIGLALDRVQIRRFKRDQKQDAQVTWDRLRSSIRNFFESSPEPHPDRWIDERKINEIADRVGDHPIQQWNRLLRDEALSSLVRFERKSSTLVHKARLLDEALRPAVIAHRPASVSKSNLSERVREVERAVRALELGMDPLSASILSAHNFPQDDFLGWVKSVNQDEHVSMLLREFREARVAAETEYESTARALASEDTNDQPGTGTSSRYREPIR